MLTSPRPRRFAALALASLALAPLSLLAPATAHACGGFFCNAQTLSPIYQAGERVVFAPDPEGGVTMHIEIAYQGEPTDFGWLLPIEAPRDAQGQIKPLEEILRVSTADLFDRLASATDPQFALRASGDNGHCASPSWGDDAAADTGGTWDTSSPSDTSGSQPPPVVVLDEANVGPYGAVLLQATSADALYDWLADNGYLQDPAARPLLGHYVDKGFVFLGLRLQSGASSGDIRPVELSLGETFACVPLRLTAIAAANDMPMLVWVLGPARAVPKNFLHAVVNPMALSWPGAANYVATVSQAVDTIHGRAFVTEFASDAPLPMSRFADWAVEALRSDLESAPDLLAVAHALDGWGHSELMSLVRSHVPMPDGLTGYPWGNCYYSPSGGGSDDGGTDSSSVWCEPDAEHVTTEAEFYRFLAWWVEELERREQPLVVDAEALRAALLNSFVEPRERIDAMFARSPWVTRFFTTMSSDEMSRDPIFAFNPELPAVDTLRTTQALARANESCTQGWVHATYESGAQARFECSSWACSAQLRSLPPVPGAPALLRVEILDEQGPPLPFDPAAADQADRLLHLALPGTPSLPAGATLPPPPAEVPEAPIVVGADGGVLFGPDVAGDDVSAGHANDAALDDSCGCRIRATSRSSGTGAMALGALLGLGLVARRRRR